ncbi:hypothetical protein AB205_0157840 [Aquarana catesbeiana]|uniref:Uncharacterized protein n=1 Tax=Aquarana catesbeiana TaxID=8400 RepID=A0A2G9RNC9_AQUCT|nr:hypothetical protein AB205_0157840 [Aquarana catesbeiana]
MAFFYLYHICPIFYLTTGTISLQNQVLQSQAY